MKDAARLLAYAIATLLFGALAAPPLYWAARRFVPALGGFDFESFFHRALLVGALLFLWPLLRSLEIRRWRDLQLEKNDRALRDVSVGAAAAAIPLLLGGVVLVLLGIWILRPAVDFAGLLQRTASAVVVPFIEEPIFRGLLLGILLRSMPAALAMFLSSALFSILHFLKAPEGTSTVVTWASGFVSIGNAFSQFADPMLVLASFTTLFLLGWILADARIRTRSLWLPIGLHAGWIFANALFNKVAQRQFEALPWIGRNLLIGLAPLGVAVVTWALVRWWLSYVERPRT
ncbi:MAG TPA: CPBP family intramembrane glutamic endopeptidase [Chthoniobacterales bacterium]|nr:CPBP family intramembrane glutamic endopeptidase [Chthoniobacterales bacterium]